MRIIDRTPLRCDLAPTEPTNANKAQHAPLAWISTVSGKPYARYAHRDGLVLEHLGLARAMAVAMRAKLPVHVDLDDLVQAGVIGLLDAAKKFDADKQEDFSRYAKYRIKGAILDSLRQLDWASRDMRRSHKRAEAVKCDLTATLKRAPTETEVAETLGMDVVRYRTTRMDLENMGPVSGDTRGDQHNDFPTPESAGNPNTQPDFIYVRKEMRIVLGKAIKTLPHRYQKVVMLYYTEELTMKEIGGMLGINESRVSQVHKLALEKMAIVLNDKGIDSSYAFQA
jgi:RNA polymerase sigma factor for flagellar operon FliA